MSLGIASLAGEVQKAIEVLSAVTHNTVTHKLITQKPRMIVGINGLPAAACHDSFNQDKISAPEKS